MEIGKLSVQERTETGKGAARKLRAQGLIPGICYGSGLESPLSVTVDPKQLRAALDPVKRQNSVIDLTIEKPGGNQQVTAMLREYQVHTLRREATHVDLLAIDPDKLVTTEIPVEVIGKAPGVVEGGKLHLVLRTVHVRCKPANIPAKVVLDVSSLELGAALHISDLSFPDGVEPVDPPQLTIANCLAPRGRDDKAEADAGETAAEGDAPKEDGDKK